MWLRNEDKPICGSRLRWLSNEDKSGRGSNIRWLKMGIIVVSGLQLIREM